MSRQKGDIMREVLISIQPKWCKLICSKEKTVEVRKNRPNCELPFKCYIYCTKRKPTFTQSAFCDDISNGKVIGEFVCDRITEYECSSVGFGELATTCGTCLTYDEILNYCNGNDLYGWHITDLVVYDEPRGLSDFLLYNVRAYIDEKNGLPMPTHEISRPFQSWGYVKAKEPRQTAD